MTYSEAPSLAGDESLFDVDLTNRSLLTRKQTRRSSGNTIISLEEVLNITLEPDLEDSYLAKQQRLSEQQAESLIPYHVPTPKPMLLPTPSSPSSCSRASNNGQGSSTGSPVPSPHNLDKENNNNSAYAQGVVGKSNRKGSNNQARQSYKDYLSQVKMSSRPQARCFQQSKRINRPVQEGERRPVTRSQTTMPTRKLRNVTSSQLRQLSRPRSNSAS